MATEIIYVELTPEEIAEREASHQEFLAREAALEAREEAKVSAVAKLAKLGLTEEEAKAIVGI